MVKFANVSLVIISSRFASGCWRCLMVCATSRWAAVTIALVASSDFSVKLSRLITLPESLSKVQNSVNDTGWAPCMSCLILTMIDRATVLL